MNYGRRDQSSRHLKIQACRGGEVYKGGIPLVIDRLRFLVVLNRKIRRGDIQITDRKENAQRSSDEGRKKYRKNQERPLHIRILSEFLNSQNLQNPESLQFTDFRGVNKKNPGPFEPG